MSQCLDMFRLDGKVAIITGGSQSLGFDVACAFADVGADVIITSRTLSRAEEACSSIREKYGVDTLALEFDQRFHDQTKRMAEEAYAWKHRIDVLVNNAGGGSGSSEGDLFLRSPDDEANLISTNLTGLLYCCKEVGRFMVKQKGGKIINIASSAGLVGRDRRMYTRNDKMSQPIDYAAAKAGVIGLTRDLAARLSSEGVYVNAISPGGFDSGNLPEAFVHDYADATMLGRMGKLGIDLKGAALFLASEASDYVTASNLVLDGGFSVFK